MNKKEQNIKNLIFNFLYFRVTFFRLALRGVGGERERETERASERETETESEREETVVENRCDWEETESEFGVDDSEEIPECVSLFCLDFFVSFAGARV